MSKQKGFTLVELIVVIVILGILAATALPKFVDLSSDARGGVMRGVEGAARGANTMIYGRAAAAGRSNQSGVAVSGTSTVDVMTQFGYAQSLAQLSGVMDLSPAADFAMSGNNTIVHANAANSATCAVTYGPPASVSGTPTYTTVTTGC